MRYIASMLAAALCWAQADRSMAQAQDPAGQDLACMVVVTLLATRMTDPTQKQGATAGFAYYMGRLKARDPGIDLKVRLVAETKAMLGDPVRFKAEAQRCGQDMQVWGRETQEVGEALKAAGRELMERPAS